MTYNVFGGTLSLTQSINQPLTTNQKKLVQSDLIYSIIGHVLPDERPCPWATCLHVNVPLALCVTAVSHQWSVDDWTRVE